MLTILSKIFPETFENKNLGIIEYRLDHNSGISFLIKSAGKYQEVKIEDFFFLSEENKRISEIYKNKGYFFVGKIQLSLENSDFEIPEYIKDILEKFSYKFPTNSDINNFRVNIITYILALKDLGNDDFGERAKKIKDMDNSLGIILKQQGEASLEYLVFLKTDFNENFKKPTSTDVSERVNLLVG